MNFFGETKICEFNMPLSVKKNILRLEIAIHYTIVM